MLGHPCARNINAIGIIETLADAMLMSGIPVHIRSHNGPEMVAKILREWLTTLGTRNLNIEPGSPWEKGFCEPFKRKLRDKCLNDEILYSLREAQEVIGRWHTYYNSKRPHSALGYRPPAPLTVEPKPTPLAEASNMHSLSQRLVQNIGPARQLNR